MVSILKEIEFILLKKETNNDERKEKASILNICIKIYRIENGNKLYRSAGKKN